MVFFSARVFKLTKLIDMKWEKSFHCWIHKISHYGRCWHLLEIKGHHPSRSFSCHWLLWCTFFSWQNVKMIFIYNFFYQSGGKCGRILIQRLKTLLRWCRLHEIKGHHPSLLGQWLLWFICSDEVWLWNAVLNCMYSSVHLNLIRSGFSKRFPNSLFLLLLTTRICENQT